MTDARAPGQGRSAALVGAGILASRISGFLRDVIIAAAFGLGGAMDAYGAALRIPNAFRNLLSEGALSASFVPVFSSQLETGDAASARRLAQGVLGRLLALTALVVAAATAAAPWLVALLAPGFDAELSADTARLVRILFPMSGVMIVGAWCLGILTSHRRFFLPFVAPVVWNLSQIVGLLLGARLGWASLIEVLAWSTLIGSLLQVGVQLPAVRRLIGTLRPRIDRGFEPTSRVARNAVPVAAGQGIFQISSLTDVFLASLLVEGAFSGIYYAQRIALLPLALFGASIAVAALPEMSRERDVEALRSHLATGVRRVAWFIFPSVVVLLLLGDLAVSLIYQRGNFNPDHVPVVHWILGAYALGLVATSLTKLFASAFHALQDTRTPVKYAATGVVLGIAVGATAALWLDARGFGLRAAAGIVFGGSVGAWINLALLTRGLGRRGGGGWLAPVRGSLVRMGLGALLAGGVAWLLRAWLEAALPDGFLGHALMLAIALAGGGLCYVAVAGLPTALRAIREDA
ncbi:murein biosynthesis integral membrane protein MurJ [Candidatus Palauibacter sp.]|uniref:murein biosynthesis integral membrane protein MurJ n=1 Tax=Candidatus Palauibacter sp. TaxID=3101350 RepID=UPI003AF28134